MNALNIITSHIQNVEPIRTRDWSILGSTRKDCLYDIPEHGLTYSIRWEESEIKNVNLFAYQKSTNGVEIYNNYG